MPAKIKVLEPELRFPEFKGDWDLSPIDRFVERYSEPVNVELKETYREIGVRSHGKGIFHKSEISGESLGNKRVFWVHPNAFIVNIVFAWEQAVAVTSNNEKGFIASHRFPMYLSRKNKVDLDFLLRFFKRTRGKYLLGLASPGGAGRNKTLGKQEFARLEIAIPEIDEQQKIASFLKAVDEKIIYLRCKHNCMQTYRRGVMQKIFSQEIRFTQVDGSAFPDWDIAKLSDLSELITKGTTPTSLGYSYLDKGVNFIKAESISSTFFIDIDSTPKISDDCNEALRRSQLAERDILFSIAGTLGRTAIVKAKDLPANTNQALAIIRLKKDKNQSYINFYLNSRDIKKRISQLLSVGAQPNLSLEQVGNFRIPLPCKDEQMKIANSISVLDAKIDSIEQQISQMEAFKKGLQQKMFV